MRIRVPYGDDYYEAEVPYVDIYDSQNHHVFRCRLDPEWDHVLLEGDLRQIEVESKGLRLVHAKYDQRSTITIDEYIKRRAASAIADSNSNGDLS